MLRKLPHLFARQVALVLLGMSTFAPKSTAAEVPEGSPTGAPPVTGPEWRVMDYGPYMSATIEVSKGNIANKGIAIRLDHGPGGISQGRDFFLFETDTLRAAAGWTGEGFIDWRNIAFDGTHEIHASVVGTNVFANPDAPGWADPSGNFRDVRIQGRDGNRYGPLPRDWAHWRGLYVDGDNVVLSYTVGDTEVLESPGLEANSKSRLITRTFEIGPRSRPLVLQVGEKKGLREAEAIVPGVRAFTLPQGVTGQTQASANVTLITLSAPVDGIEWGIENDSALRLQIKPGRNTLRFKLIYGLTASENSTEVAELLRTSPAVAPLNNHTHGGAAHWTNIITTKLDRIFDAKSPYTVEGVGVPFENPWHAWMRLSAFDFFSDPTKAAVCTWQGDVWIVDGLGGDFSTFHWKRVASGLFQPLGLKIVNDQIYVTCRDQITVLHDLNQDGETDFYQNFNNDAQVTEHFHEFAMDLQTDPAGNFYYAKGGRHAKDALVPQHGTLLRVSKDGAKTEIIAYGFRAPNGVGVHPDGTMLVSDQEGHWTPENRINWIKPGGFYGYMMGYHEGRGENDFEPPVVWIHKSLDRSPAEQLWVTSSKWGLPTNAVLSLSYGTGKVLGVLIEQVGDVHQGGVFAMPIPAMPTGIMRGRFNEKDGQLYVAGLFGWAGDKTKPGGFYRIRYSGKPVPVPVALHARKQGMELVFDTPLDPESAGDAENYAVSRWTYKRTANYGSEDYKISVPGQRGRDSVQVTAAKLSSDRKTVLLLIPDLQPCTQMEIKYNIETEKHLKISNLIENTILVVGGDSPLASQP